MSQPEVQTQVKKSSWLEKLMPLLIILGIGIALFMVSKLSMPDGKRKAVMGGGGYSGSGSGADAIQPAGITREKSGEEATVGSNEQQRLTLLGEAEQLENDRKFVEAIEKYKQAAPLFDDGFVEPKIEALRDKLYYQHLDEAKRLMDAGDISSARKAADAAHAYRSASLMKERIDRMESFLKEKKAAEEALKKGDTKEAVARLNAAATLTDDPNMQIELQNKANEILKR